MKNLVRRPKGFTLVELMMVVAIVGLLSSVAMPAFKDFTLRSRQSERRLVMRTIRQSAQDIYVRNGRVETKAGVHLPVLWGQPNPPGVPSATKRPYAAAVAGWDTLGVTEQFIEGSLYYTYEFILFDVTPDQFLWMQGEGDLDLDNRRSLRIEQYTLNEQSYQLAGEFPLGGGTAQDVDAGGVPTW